MMSIAPHHRRSAFHAVLAVLALMTALLDPTRAGAQQPASDVAGARQTRADLEALKAAAERSSDPDVRARAAFIADRLRLGDFQPGDRVVVAITATDARVDTLIVRSDRSIDIPAVTQVSLAGVLRSELAAHLDSAVARYVRGARVEATSLVRLSVMGEVLRPGFYSFTSNMLLSDVLMAAGGPTAAGDLARIELRRDGEALFGPGVARSMVDNGFTLDDAGVRPGDEVYLGKRRTVSQTTIISWITAIGSLVALAAALAG